ncbi:MAG: hypothetical protein FJ304_11985 [Planctomycetes bacterium]|nr:hypothetical protein [Planctomycetota bacterium]
MTRSLWKSALALGAVLAATSATSAGDTVPLTGAGGATLTLGGQGTPAQAAGEDNELTHGRRYYGGGWGYRGGYYTGYRGWNGGWGGYYRPVYYYAPRVYYPTYYRVAPVYPTYYFSDCAPGVSFTFGISGGAASGAPALNLGARPVPQPMPSVGPDGTFRYDGGPAVPVPLPKADPQLIPPASPLPSATDLPISGKPKPAPYKYKAYGEK